MNFEEELAYKGGLIYHIPNDLIYKIKSNDELPQKVEEVVNLLSFPDSNHIISNETFLFGSYNLRVQPYYADIDLRSEIILNLSREDAIKFTVDSFKHIARKVEFRKGSFFTDAKAGIYEDGEAVHWTYDELMQGFRNGNIEDFNGHLGNKTLYDAITDKPKIKNTNVLLKIDAVIPFYGKYIECTCVYTVYYINKNGELRGLNIEDKEDDETERGKIVKTLVQDTKKQFLKDKLFKTIKRIFALSKYYKDTRTSKKIAPLLVSNISKLSSISSDLKTLELLVQLDKKINKNFVNIELNMIVDKISNILDVELDIDGMIKNIKELYQYIRKDDKENALKKFKTITEYIDYVTNSETIEYLKSIGFRSFYDFGPKYIK